MQAVLSQQVSVVLVGEPCLCLAHHCFPGPLWVQQTLSGHLVRDKKGNFHFLFALCRWLVSKNTHVNTIYFSTLEWEISPNQAHK